LAPISIFLGEFYCFSPFLKVWDPKNFFRVIIWVSLCLFGSLFRDPFFGISRVNSPEELQYTQGLEQTIVQKYSAVKEVFNNLSGDETESAESKPSSPLSPALITGLSLRNTSQSRFVPPLLPDTLVDESAPEFNYVIEGTT
jgi:hypothetical protein